VGSIGVSNFTIEDLENLLPYVRINPHINQLGIFVGHTLNDLRAYCHKHEIIIQGHSPLARGRIFQIDEIHDLAKKFGITPAQVALKYVLAKGVYPVVKASKENHLKENLSLDISLPPYWYQSLDLISKDVRDYKPPNSKGVL
jgi:diketogulonate reductase-like aldo/keto reductase